MQTFSVRELCGKEMYYRGRKHHASGPIIFRKRFVLNVKEIYWHRQILNSHFSPIIIIPQRYLDNCVATYPGGKVVRRLSWFAGEGAGAIDAVHVDAGVWPVGGHVDGKAAVVERAEGAVQVDGVHSDGRSGCNEKCYNNHI